MKLKLKAFPVVYFTAHCKKHDCYVGIRTTTTTDRTDTDEVGGQITAMMCQVGGEPRTSNCVDDWELSVSSTGKIVVE